MKTEQVVSVSDRRELRVSVSTSRCSEPPGDRTHSAVNGASFVHVIFRRAGPLLPVLIFHQGSAEQTPDFHLFCRKVREDEGAAHFSRGSDVRVFAR